MHTNVASSLMISVMVSCGQLCRYDGVAGAYGCMGGPTKGSAPPGLQAGTT